MADALMKYETIDKYQIDDLMERKPVRAPQGWDDLPPRGGVRSDDFLSKDKVEPSIGKTAEQS
jgi:cell division protease FtsH